MKSGYAMQAELEAERRRSGRMGAMPNKPKTPMRTIRISDEEWAAAQEKAEREGTNVSEVLRQALRDYIESESQK